MLEMYFRNEKAAYIIELFELETEAQEIQISVTGNEFSIKNVDKLIIVEGKE